MSALKLKYNKYRSSTCILKERPNLIHACASSSNMSLFYSTLTSGYRLIALDWPYLHIHMVKKNIVLPGLSLYLSAFSWKLFLCPSLVNRNFWILSGNFLCSCSVVDDVYLPETIPGKAKVSNQPGLLQLFTGKREQLHWKKHGLDCRYFQASSYKYFKVPQVSMSIERRENSQWLTNIPTAGRKSYECTNGLYVLNKLKCTLNLRQGVENYSLQGLCIKLSVY